MKTAAIVLIGLALSGCASAPSEEHPNWAPTLGPARNYRAFPIAQLRTGMPKAEVFALLSPGSNLKLVSGGVGGETYTAERWRPILLNPDVPDERLIMRFLGDRLAAWRVDKAEPLPRPAVVVIN